MCPTPRLALGDSQVEIEVLATGLNFKDVLFTTGLLRQQPVRLRCNWDWSAPDALLAWVKMSLNLPRERMLWRC